MKTEKSEKNWLILRNKMANCEGTTEIWSEFKLEYNFTNDQKRTLIFSYLLPKLGINRADTLPKTVFLLNILFQAFRNCARNINFQAFTNCAWKDEKETNFPYWNLWKVSGLSWDLSTINFLNEFVYGPSMTESGFLTD